MISITKFNIYTIYYNSLCIPHYYSGDQMQKDVIGGACSTYEGEESGIQDFGGET
jgi:hypothetical protein